MTMQCTANYPEQKCISLELKVQINLDQVSLTYIEVCLGQKVPEVYDKNMINYKEKITKGQSETVNRRRTDNTMPLPSPPPQKKQQQKTNKTMIYKAEK